jgi:hypothetical protein
MAVGKRYLFFPFKNFTKNKKNKQDNGITSGGLENHLAIAIDPKEKVRRVAEIKPALLPNSSFTKK